jgi:hypothetical protein
MTVWPVSSSSRTVKVVLLGELLDRGAELLLVALGLRLDGDVDDRLGEGHGLEDDRGVLGAQGVTGGGVLEADERVDVARVGLLDRVLLVGVHLEHLPDALLLPLGGVEDHVALRHLARVDPDVGELAEERVDGNLERESREGLVLAGCAGQLLLLVTRLVPDHRGHVERGGQVVDDRVEDGLDALVLEGAAAEDRVRRTRDGERADATLDLLDGELLAAEVLSRSSSSASATCSMSSARYWATFSTRSAGTSSIV